MASPDNATLELPASTSGADADLRLHDFELLAAGGTQIGNSQLEFAAWIALFCCMIFVATSGNLIVVFIVATNRNFKSVTNYFLVNLSLADAMVSTLNVIFNFVSMLISHWPFGKLYCKVSNFIAILSISASVFTLTAIACDR